MSTDQHADGQGAGAQGGAIFAVIPTFSRPGAALAVAEALAAQRIPAAAIVVVDHARSPIVDPERAGAAGVTLVRGGADLWWSGAVNLGLGAVLERAAAADHVLIVNDDVALGAGLVDALRAVARSDPRALVGSACVDGRTGRVLYADLRLDRVRASFSSCWSGRTPEELPRGAELPCHVLSGRGVLVPVRALRDVGLLDARRLPHYSADYELAWRARLAGYRLVCATDARVTTERGPRADAARGSLVGYALDRRRAGNLPAAAGFARLCFSPPYAAWFLALTGARLCWGYLEEREGAR